MKSLLTLCFIVSTLGVSVAQADEPCKAVRQACEAAGYVHGAHKKTGKGLMVDCMKPIMEGQTVAGVTVAPAEVEACKAKRAEHKKR